LREGSPRRPSTSSRPLSRTALTFRPSKSRRPRVEGSSFVPRRGSRELREEFFEMRKRPTGHRPVRALDHGRAGRPRSNAQERSTSASSRRAGSVWTGSTDAWRRTVSRPIPPRSSTAPGRSTSSPRAASSSRSWAKGRLRYLGRHSRCWSKRSFPGPERPEALCWRHPRKKVTTRRSVRPMSDRLAKLPTTFPGRLTQFLTTTSRSINLCTSNYRAD
jgi:hypothetical protein